MRTIIPKNAKLIPENAELVFKGKIFDVYHWPQKMYDGSVKTFERLKRPDTIKVLAIKDEKVVVLEQKQPDSDQSYFDLPGGRHDYDEEDELAAAKRETLEETGMSFKDWRLIGINQPHGKIDWLVYLFLATGFEDQQQQNLDSGEKIDIKPVSFNELRILIKDPKAKYLPKDLIESCSSIDDLLRLPEYRS